MYSASFSLVCRPGKGLILPRQNMCRGNCLTSAWLLAQHFTADQSDGTEASAHSSGHMWWQPNILNVTETHFQIQKFAGWD